MDETVLLQDEEYHHLKVMRLQENEEVELVNGQNQLALCRILSFRKKEAALHILHLHSAPPPYPVILCQALPRLNRVDTIIEKGTELGATSFWFFEGEKSEKKSFSESQKKRWASIAISAMKQCGRLDLPTLAFKSPLSHWQELEFSNYGAYFGDLDSEAYLPSVWQKNEGSFIFIGPEAGFSEKEIEKLRSLKVKGAKLHSFILRTDTASLVALSQIHLLMNTI